MASYISEENILNQFAITLSTCLGNPIVRKVCQYDICGDEYKFRFDFKNNEIFGKVLVHTVDAWKIDRSIPYSQLEDMVKDVLMKTIENLPRADRIERERLWNIKPRKENEA